MLLQTLVMNITLDDPLTLLNNIKKGKISMKQAIKQQYNFRKYLNLIRIGNKNDNQKRTLANINIFYNARDNAIQFIQDYGGMILENNLVKDLKY